MRVRRPSVTRLSIVGNVGLGRAGREIQAGLRGGREGRGGRLAKDGDYGHQGGDSTEGRNFVNSLSLCGGVNYEIAINYVRLSRTQIQHPTPNNEAPGSSRDSTEVHSRGWSHWTPPPKYPTAQSPAHGTEAR